MTGRGLEALVRKERLELSRPFGHWILSPARLPIPPLSPDPRLQAPPLRLQTPGNPRGIDRRRRVDGFRYDWRACSRAPDSARTRSSPRSVPAGWARSTGLVTTRLNRDVAVKVLPAAFATDADRLARFTREAQTLAALNHPHIAQVHGLEESGSTRALVMELVDGDDLSATSRAVRCPRTTRCRSPARSPTHWPPPTTSASSTATSSPPT
jgi:serine/threonine protein kinase